MFVLPSPNQSQAKPTQEIPTFSSIRTFKELLKIYHEDFVPFCQASKTQLDDRINFTKVGGFLNELDDAVFVRSLVREHDQLILKQLFETFQKFRQELQKCPDSKFKVLEIGAGYSYSFDPEHLSAPWLSRWLAARFPELEIVVSDIASYWDQAMEQKQFKIADAISLDYCQLDQGNLPKFHFLCGRHLNVLVPERTLDETYHSEDFFSISYWSNSNTETEDLLNGVCHSLMLGGQAVIDFDRGPLFDLVASEFPTFRGTRFRFLEDVKTRSRVFPDSEQLIPSLAQCRF